ncbi:MAG: outer membrane beta-barrel protein [Myxococcota bacterium]
MPRFIPILLEARPAYRSLSLSAPSPRAERAVERAFDLVCGFALLVAAGLLVAHPAAAQAGMETSRAFETSAPGSGISDPGGPDTGWSARAGIGFTGNPSTFLMNFEAPYAFNEWIALGPMLQLGLDDDYTFAAPTLNTTVKFPNFLGPAFDRVVPYALGGLGLAVIENEDAPNDKRSVGFLIDFGFGVEYQLSDRLFVGTQMMFDFMPKQTQGQKFIYAWQIGGLRYAF